MIGQPANGKLPPLTVLQVSQFTVERNRNHFLNFDDEFSNIYEIKILGIKSLKFAKEIFKIFPQNSVPQIDHLEALCCCCCCAKSKQSSKE